MTVPSGCIKVDNNSYDIEDVIKLFKCNGATEYAFGFEYDNIEDQIRDYLHSQGYNEHERCEALSDIGEFGNE